MNTPAHALVNLAALSGGRTRSALGADPEAGSETALAAAVLAGGVAPDLPMVAFYGWQKLVRGVPEGIIWGELYFDPGWQALFDAFNSLPLIAVGLYVAWRLGSAPGAGFFASMALHVLADVPLHADDAHRPFFPLSDWRFQSPISYWDPAHHGRLVGALEAVAVAVCCVVALRRFEARAVRALVAAGAALYLSQWAWAAVIWG